MQLGQEWRTENSNRYFPFAEGSTIPKDFISDIKFLHNKRGPEEVYLSKISICEITTIEGTYPGYALTFNFSSDDSEAIHGEVLKDHGQNQVYLFDTYSESVVVFSTGDFWHNPPESWTEHPDDITVSGKIDNSLVSSGPNLIRRIAIYGETNDESTWRKETTQSIKGGTNVDIQLIEGDVLIPNQQPQDFIEISAVYGGGSGAPDYTPEDGILTINGISPVNGDIKLSGFDCIKEVDRPDDADNSIQVRSDCLPCCGCSSYQLISDAITYRSQKLSELCGVLNGILNSSVDTYNAAVLALADSERPVARIRAIRVYQDRIKMALQNVCAIPIYGRYGVTISGGNFFNSSPSSVEVLPLSASSKYNSHINDEIEDMPIGAFTGIVGPISPGSYVDLEFTALLSSDGGSYHILPYPFSGDNGAVDLRSLVLTIDTQANGHFGSGMMLGCKKDEYSVTVSPDTSIESSCNSSPDGVRYKIELNEAPEAP